MSASHIFENPIVQVKVIVKKDHYEIWEDWQDKEMWEWEIIPKDIWPEEHVEADDEYLVLCRSKYLWSKQIIHNREMREKKEI